MCSDDDDARTLQGDEFGPGADAFSMEEEDVAATPTPPTPTPSESGGDRRHSSTETLEQQETEEELTPRGSAANLILQPEEQNAQQQPHYQPSEQVNP